MRIEITAVQRTVISYSILLAILAALLSVTIAPPVLGRLAFFERLENLREVHARSIAVIAAATASQAEPAPVKDSNADRLYFRGDTSALAGAELQNLVKEIIEGEGALLVSSAFRQRDEPLPLTPITVTVRARCSVEALKRVLFLLDGHEPVLFVDSLLIQTRHRPGRELRDPSEELDVDFDVTGYLNRPFEP